MVIYTSTHIQLYQITNITEPQYIENIPYSLQKKLSIPKSIVIKYYKGKPFIYCKTREIDPLKVPKIIKVINGYAKTYNQVLYR